MVALLIALVIVESVTVAAVVLSQRIKTNEALERHTRQLLQDVVDETRENALGFLTPAQNVVLLTKRLFASGLLSLERPEELERFFLDNLAIVPQIDGLYFAAPDGRFLFTKRSGEKRGSSYVTKVIARPDGRRRVHRIWRDARHLMLAREDNVEDAYDPRERLWHERAQASDTLIWSEPYVFFTSKKPGLTAAMSLADESKAPIGTVGADVELGALSDFLAAEQVTSLGGAVVLLHRNSDVLAYSFPGRLPKPQGLRFRLAHLDELDSVSAAAAQALRAKFPDFAALQHPQYDSFEIDGRRMLTMFVPLSEQSQWPWLMGVYAPEEHFVGTIRASQRQATLLAIAISVAITILAFALSPRLVRPLTALQERAVRDPLTGLLNRRSFMELAVRILEKTKRASTRLSAIMIDIDRFKSINDTFGHQVGDEVLVAVAGRIKKALSDAELVARHGGEEFAVLLPSLDIAKATVVAERLRTIVADVPVSTTAGEVVVTISVGVAELELGGVETISSLLNVADLRLLQAKRNGRNRVVAASQGAAVASSCAAERA